MKLIFSIEGTMAMHFAPDMMLSGMPRSGASMIWLRMVVGALDAIDVGAARTRLGPRRGGHEYQHDNRNLLHSSTPI